jgi:predicted branched-subunit amino acid permease
MTAILHRLALGMGITAFIVVAVSSSLAGASPTSVVTRGVAAFVAFGLFGLVALRGVVLGVIRELAKQAEEKRQKELGQQHKHDDQADMPLPE